MYQKPDGSASLTGVGYLNSLDELVAPEDRDRYYWEPEAVMYEETRFPKVIPHLPTFLLHDTCWRVFLERISYGRDAREYITDLVQMFYRATYYREVINSPRHDYGDIGRFWSGEHEDAEELLDSNGLGYVESTPEEYVTMKGLLVNLEWACKGMPEGLASNVASSEIYTGPISSTFHRPENGSTDPFARFPTEVIHTLLSWTDSEDILLLSLASRAVASKAHPDLLPQSFWYSRFGPDFEMGFALPRCTEGYCDWQSLYFMVKWAIEERIHDSLRNRRRIWNFFPREKKLYQAAFKNRQDGSTVEKELGH